MTVEQILALLVLLPLLLPWLGALVVWLVGDQRPFWQHRLAVAFSMLAGAAAVGLIFVANGETAVRFTIGGAFGVATFVPDAMGVLLAVIATVVGSLAVLFSVSYMDGAAQLGRYYSLVLLFIGAMVGLVLSGSLLLLFIFWEMTALCSYALISFHNDDPKAVAGGIKALIITQLGGVGLLAGVLAAYAALGDFQIASLLAQVDGVPVGTLSLIAYGFLLAATAKSAQVPLHTWLPDAMEAPTPVSALIHAATMVNAGVYLLLRFYPAFVDVPGWTTAVTVIGLLSVLIAGVMALSAMDLKRVLAYSTVSQLGYMVAAVGIGALFAGQMHLLSHAIFKALLFLGAGAMIHTFHTRDMRALGGMWQRMRGGVLLFLLGAASLVGLPGFSGFWSKELILEHGADHAPLWATVGLMLGVGLTAAYTLRMVAYLLRKNSHSQQGVKLPLPMSAALVPLAVGAVLVWLLFGPYSHFAEAAGPAALAHAETTWALAGAILTHPATWAALLLILLGAAGWWVQARRPAAALQAWLARQSDAGWGFEWLNGRIAAWTQQSGSLLQLTQTGQLAWNLIGILLAALLVGLILLQGVG